MTTQPAAKGHRPRRLAIRVTVGICAVASSFASVAAGSTAGASTPRPSASVIRAVGAESEYANVIAQIGGKYVSVVSMLNNPNTDPHTFESSPSVARAVSAAQLIVQNGVGYDTFMNKTEAASPNPARKVITVQSVLGLANNTPNPHLWYAPKTMPAVAKAIAKDLSALEPAHASYFQAHLRTFERSLDPWLSAIAAFRTKYRGTNAATTEPVADYLLEAMGIDNRTPFGFQTDVMNGVDPSPQDISLETRLLSEHTVKVFLYNQQVVDSLTTSIRMDAEKAKIPVVGVYETMPTPGYTYQTWMVAEVKAITAAVAHKVSTNKL